MSLTPLVQSLSGHSGQVSAMAGEAGWLVTGGRDAVARLWASTQQQWRHVRDMAGHKSPVGAGVAISASKSSIRRFVITEKAPTRAFTWLKAATTAFTFKTLLRHYAKQELTHGK